MRRCIYRKQLDLDAGLDETEIGAADGFFQAGSPRPLFDRHLWTRCGDLAAGFGAFIWRPHLVRGKSTSMVWLEDKFQTYMPDFLPLIVVFFLPLILVCWLVWRLISTWWKRKNRRATLSRTLGGDFNKDRSFVQSERGIAVDETSRKFAIVDERKAALLSAEDIIGLEWNDSPWLRIETRNQEFPRTTFYTDKDDERLSETYARLKAMETPISSTATTGAKPEATVEEAKIVAAIRRLTEAVTTLAEAVNSLPSITKRPP
jgi:hypothetical protein